MIFPTFRPGNNRELPQLSAKFNEELLACDGCSKEEVLRAKYIKQQSITEFSKSLCAP
jgi:hypothetical protein